MRNDSNLLEPLLDEEDPNRSISVRRPSFRDKLWGIVAPSPAALCISFEKRIRYGMPCFSHKSTMTEAARPSVKQNFVLWVLGLFALLALLFLGALLCFFYNPFTGPQRLPNAERIRAEKNTTAAAFSAVPENLTLATLLAAELEEPSLGAMRNCLKTAAEEFSKEPSIIQRNARMILQCNGTQREFLSGKGENLIEVVWLNQQALYTLVREAHPDVHLARLGRHPFHLNLSTLSGILQDVAAHNGSEELRSCLRKALAELPWEPVIVQDNSKMVVSCGGANLTFISGEGKTEISVFREEPHGEIQYMVKATGWASFLRFLIRGRIH